MNCIKRTIWSVCALGFLCLSFGLQAQEEDILDQEVTIVFEELSVKDSLEKLEEEVNISTAYNDLELDDETITLTFEKELLSEVLDVLLESKNLSYKVIGNTITVFRKPAAAPTPSVTAETKAKPKKNEEKYTISGYITDATSQETLIGVNLYIAELEVGVTTNEYGFYSITLPKGEYSIAISYVGYETTVEQVLLDKDTSLSTTMGIRNELSTVVVTDNAIQQRHTESKMSSNKLSMAKLKAMPVLMGERDVLKMVQLMPGVQSGSEGSTGLYVRGGGPDQNLILVDGVPVYNVNHVFGFLSTLNGDAIKSAEIIKGGFPARHGGRLSSILDVRMKDGNMEQFHGDISVGIVAGKINLEGPIVKNKTSFHFSARRTWIDMIAKPIQKAQTYEDGEKRYGNFFFYDVTAKINHKFSDKSRLYFSTYFGNDITQGRFDAKNFDEEVDLKWGNKIGALRWNYQITPKIFSNTTLYTSNYAFDFSDDLKETEQGQTLHSTFDSTSKIEDYGLKVDLNYLPTPNHHIRFGAGGLLHEFTPTVNSSSISETGETPTAVVSGDKVIEAQEYTAYIEDDMSIGNRVKLNAGLHFAVFEVIDKSYSSLQPRAALNFALTEKSALKLSYSHMFQPLHLLASPGLGLPTDLWVPSTKLIKPEKSVQYGLGYTQSLRDGWEATAEVFYKDMDNLLEYKSGFNIFSNSKDWQERVIVGTGRSYGLEILLEKTMGKTTGWMGYTLSKSERSFPDLNNGEYFPYKYDRTHDISLAVTHKRSKRLDFGLIWVYGSGNTYTLGTSNINALTAGTDPYFGNGNLSNLATVNNVEHRNNQRVPAYHRLDLSINLHKEKKRGVRTWSFGLYNAYSRQNPWVVSVRERQDGSGDQYLQQLSLLPVIPFANYSFKF